jgi:hypothetical protein
VIPVSANNQMAASPWAKFKRWARKRKFSIEGKKITSKMFAVSRTWPPPQKHLFLGDSNMGPAFLQIQKLTEFIARRILGS